MIRHFVDCETMTLIVKSNDPVQHEIFSFKFIDLPPDQAFAKFEKHAPSLAKVIKDGPDKSVTEDFSAIFLNYWINRKPWPHSFYLNVETGEWRVVYEMVDTDNSLTAIPVYVVIKFIHNFFTFKVFSGNLEDVVKDWRTVLIADRLTSPSFMVLFKQWELKLQKLRIKH